jgi:hypothetical protein
MIRVDVHALELHAQVYGSSQMQQAFTWCTALRTFHSKLVCTPVLGWLLPLGSPPLPVQVDNHRYKYQSLDEGKHWPCIDESGVACSGQSTSRLRALLIRG